MLLQLMMSLALLTPVPELVEGPEHISDLEITKYLYIEYDADNIIDRITTNSISYTRNSIGYDGMPYSQDVYIADVVLDGNPVVFSHTYYNGGAYLPYIYNTSFHSVTWDRKRIYYEWWDSKLMIRVKILAYDSEKDKNNGK